jgi:hypothetical protein
MEPVMTKRPEKLCKVRGPESESVPTPIGGENLPNHFSSISEPPPVRFRMAIERLCASGEPR